MLGPLSRFGWSVAITLPISAVSIGVLVAAFGALTARRPATRRHCLDVIDHLTEYVAALRAVR